MVHHGTEIKTLLSFPHYQAITKDLYYILLLKKGRYGGVEINNIVLDNYSWIKKKKRKRWKEQRLKKKLYWNSKVCR